MELDSKFITRSCWYVLSFLSPLIRGVQAHRNSVTLFVSKWAAHGCTYVKSFQPLEPACASGPRRIAANSSSIAMLFHCDENSPSRSFHRSNESPSQSTSSLPSVSSFALAEPIKQVSAESIKQHCRHLGLLSLSPSLRLPALQIPMALRPLDIPHKGPEARRRPTE